MTEPTAEDIGTAVLARIREQEQQILLLREELDRERNGRRYAENALRDAERRDWADGVWLVEHFPDGGGGSRRQIGLLADLPDPVTHAAVARHQETIAKALVAHRGSSISAMDLAGRIVAAVAEALRGEGSQQLVISRLSPAHEEHVSRPRSFDQAGEEWRHQQALLQDGGYVVWWNEDTVWRQSAKRDGAHTILSNEEARAIADRVRAADRTRCPACLAPVRINSADEGTQSYTPLGPRQDGAPERCMLCGAEP